MSKNKPMSPSGIDALVNGAIKDPLVAGLSICVLSSRKKAWKFSRWVPASKTILRRTLGFYPATTIASARSQAEEINRIIDAGNDPRDIWRKEASAFLTVAQAHALYMEAVRQGRGSAKNRVCRPVTIACKKYKFLGDISPAIGKKNIHDVVEDDLIRLVEAKGRRAQVSANRLAGELQTFFRWCSSLRGKEVGLQKDPSQRLRDLRFPEKPRSRNLNSEEIAWLLQAIAEERPFYRRGLLLLLLTATRFSEVVLARTSEFDSSVWTIPSDRTKNGLEHKIFLGPWASKIIHNDSEWLFPGSRNNRPCSQSWRYVWNRVVNHMSVAAARRLERITPHDLRRTFRTNSRRIGIDFETAEAMLNHSKSVLVRTYDRYELEIEKKQGFKLWEEEVLRIARDCGIAAELEAPSENAPEAISPKCSAVEPSSNFQ